MSILVTGGAGFIGSHAIVELLNECHSVVAIDNLSNSKNIAIKRIQDITGKAFEFVEGDIRDAQLLKDLFSKHSIDSVMHFAGLKAVGESVANPLAYYDNNIAGSVCLYKAMEEAKVFNLVFSSSATVYGDPQKIPIDETHPTGAVTNPYGQTKYMNELICADLVRSNSQWNIGILRYFNPIGAHTSGLIGEDPNDIPNNLMPFILQVASGKLKELPVFGNDWLTHDGTGVRDYIHVVDLAKAHLSCLEKLNSKFTGFNAWNVGTGKGYSVLEIVKAFESITGVKIPHKITPRRDGDIAESWADTAKASSDLDWKAESNLKQMIQDAWNWQSKNPQGYN